jgi:cation diffusion facilitator family transporter
LSRGHTHLDAHERTRIRAGLLSLSVSVLLLGAKAIAYRMTGSSAVLSDALESIVNVVAALFGLGSLWYASQPADRNHPYGHGKIEFVSAAFEGGLIAFAAVLILFESGEALLTGRAPHDVDRGLWIVLGAGLVNLALGAFLVRTGRKTSSLTLVADGKHVLSDFWTSAGVALGLGLVHVTGLGWLDPVAAALVALWLLRTGAGLVRHAAGGLLDEEDPAFVRRLIEALGERMGAGVIRVHHLRAMRNGRFHHVDAHLVVPEFWDVDRAHRLTEKVSAAVLARLGVEGELDFHTDPCHQAYCASCDLTDCPVRREPFTGITPLTLEEARRPDGVVRHEDGR